MAETREEQTALRLANGWLKVRGAMLDAGGAGWERARAPAAAARATGMRRHCIYSFALNAYQALHSPFTHGQPRCVSAGL